MSIETSKKKKGIQMPHTYIILFLIVLVVCLLTYVIPAGQFERQEDASGRMLIVPGTYTQVESSPVSPLEIPMAFVRTLGSSSVNEIIFFIFIIGGAFELIMQTGMITAFCAKLGKMFAGKEKLLIPIFITVFAVGGFTMGMSVEVLVFVPIGIAVAKAVGYDTCLLYTSLGWVGETDFLVKAAEIGVIILMFNAGMDTDLDELKTTGFASFIIALIGVIVPLIGGAACYLAFDNDPTDSMNMLKAAFIGVVLTATSVSITVETLREMGKLKSKVGTAILGAAVIDDILGIVVLTILTALTDPSVKPILVLGRIVAFFGFVLVVGLVMYRVFLKMEEKWHCLLYTSSVDGGAQSVAVGLINLRQRTVRAGGQQQLTFALGKQLSGNECACQTRRVVLAQPSADTACAGGG